MERTTGSSNSSVDITTSDEKLKVKLKLPLNQNTSSISKLTGAIQTNSYRMKNGVNF